MNNGLTCFLTAALLAAPIGAFAQTQPPEERAEDHKVLRALLANGAEALNKRSFDKIAPSLHPNFTIITADNRKHVGLDAFKQYYTSLFEGSGAILKNFDTKLVADDTTRFIDANTGVVYGTSQDTFTFKDGEVRSMQTRWSAVTKKETDGWKLVNVHFSANVLDNPVIDGVKSFYNKLIAGAAVLGAVVGALVFALVRRRG
jgi:ketosteroid isomerase-like protein